MDVGRQRHGARPGPPPRGRAAGPRRVGRPRRHRGTRPTSTTGGPDADSNSRVEAGQPASRADQGLPHVEGSPSDRLQQQHLGPPAGGLDQVQPGGQHPGVVDHHHVAGPQQAGQVGHGGVSRALRSSARPGPTSRRAALRGSTGSWAMAGGGGRSRRRPSGPRRCGAGSAERPGSDVSSDMAPWWQTPRPAGRRPVRGQRRLRAGCVLDRGEPEVGPGPGAAIRPRVVRCSRPCWRR